MGVLERLSTLILPGESNAETIDEFTHQQLIVGLKDLGMGVTSTNPTEMLSSLRRNKTVYFYPDSVSVRERNFSLLTYLGRKILRIEPIATSSKTKRGRKLPPVSFSVNEIDLSPVYEWQKRVVEELKRKYPDSIFVKGLQQALVEHLSEE